MRWTLWIAATALLAPKAYAHLNTFNASAGVGSGSFIEEAINGQYGFVGRDNPFYAIGEVLHGRYTEFPSDDYLRFGLIAGYEGKHLGLDFNFNTIRTGAPQLTATALGGTLHYRFVRWATASQDKLSMMSREQKAALMAEFQAETDAEVPKAPVASLGAEVLSLATPLSATNGISATHLRLTIRARLKPFLTLAPSIDYFSYGVAPSKDLSGARSYSSRSLRLIRIGPHRSSYSALSGPVQLVAQLYNELHIFPLLTLNMAITRATLDLPSTTAYSLWFSFDRYLGNSKRWAISPSYEHIYTVGPAQSFFTLSLKYGAGDIYLPQPEAMPKKQMPVSQANEAETRNRRSREDGYQ